MGREEGRCLEYFPFPGDYYASYWELNEREQAREKIAYMTHICSLQFPFFIVLLSLLIFVSFSIEFFMRSFHSYHPMHIFIMLFHSLFSYAFFLPPYNHNNNFVLLLLCSMLELLLVCLCMTRKKAIFWCSRNRTTWYRARSVHTSFRSLFHYGIKLALLLHAIMSEWE
jgi:hypothetical protein